uniref:Uncharacterized protein n=1 Tax=Anopheles culicifacies TaxID=139723 RepID=A0A182LRI4_9DIPT
MSFAAQTAASGHSSHRQCWMEAGTGLGSIGGASILAALLCESFCSLFNFWMSRHPEQLRLILLRTCKGKRCRVPVAPPERYCCPHPRVGSRIVAYRSSLCGPDPEGGGI